MSFPRVQTAGTKSGLMIGYIGLAVSASEEIKTRAEVSKGAQMREEQMSVSVNCVGVGHPETGKG